LIDLTAKSQEAFSTYYLKAAKNILALVIFYCDCNKTILKIKQINYPQ
jgi:hypothetical protein